MQTLCPHCNTQFRITESQVNTADGFVRCGVCKEVFNAFEVASNDELQHSLLDQEKIASEPEHNISTAENTPLEDTADDLENTDRADIPSSKDEFDFFDENIHASQRSLVPDELRESTSTVNLSGILWSAATLLLIASLFIEYTWFNRHQLNQVPELQSWIDRLCLQVDCRDISLRDPENIELISRNVYSHPNNKAALMIDITMRNNAAFAQPYPVIQIDFSDIRGGKVAARRFLPEEYLQKRAEKISLINSGENISFSMEIYDPGKHAKTYEFNFL